MSGFASLKKNSKAQFDKLNGELAKLNSPQAGSNDDDGFWKPEVDKAGNGYAIIRFLPAPEGEDVPFVRVWDHGFQGPGGWYIEKSLTTLGQKDPVSEYNSQLWNSGIEANKDQVRKQKRRVSYISNIYVVKDPSNPDNEGKVFLFKYGKKIWDMLSAAMNPEFQDEEPMNPFDLWSGANFKLKIRKVEGYRNYDKSEFEASAPLANDDEELESIWKQERPLSDFTDPKNFKSYDELQAKLYKVLGLDGGKAQPKSRAEDAYEEEERQAPAPVAKTLAAPKQPVKAAADDEDDEDFFRRLAEDE